VANRGWEMVEELKEEEGRNFAVENSSRGRSYL
jgi:hypothetical protein